MDWLDSKDQYHNYVISEQLNSFINVSLAPEVIVVHLGPHLFKLMFFKLFQVPYLNHLLSDSR